MLILTGFVDDLNFLKLPGLKLGDTDFPMHFMNCTIFNTGLCYIGYVSLLM